MLAWRQPFLNVCLLLSVKCVSFMQIAQHLSQTSPNISLPSFDKLLTLLLLLMYYLLFLLFAFPLYRLHNYLYFVSDDRALDNNVVDRRVDFFLLEV